MNDPAGRAPVVRCVLGDVPADRLGMVYAHEHLVLDSPLIAAAFAHILLDDVDTAVAEVGPCAAAGVGTMVDAMPCAAGRDAVRLAAVSARTGVNVVAATGLHHVRYYGEAHWSGRLDAGELAELFSADVLGGIDAFDYTGPAVRRTPHRAGIVKVATAERPTARDRLVLEAAALAHLGTGAPVLTHCEQGRGALAQIEALTAHGVPADAILLSHVDKVVDRGYHREIADTGAYLEYDQALRTPEDTALLVGWMLADGHGDRIVLGTDGARRDLWSSLGGGPGLAWLATGFCDLLSERGVDEADLRRLLVTNPARALVLRESTR
ncbi:phosphotriesterase [Nonomuraea sp. M3C6]|uniref:Phosphotriesterase n=1 Tax=Nonomuraea marmarensis TaxID=3351344 RepID=A0ABW7APZ4_9ACTN